MNTQKSKARIRVREGDLFCVDLDEGLVAVGIVLHISKLFKGSIMVGFYNQRFESAEDIDVKALGGEFITTPNYTGKQVITKNYWKVIGHSPDLLTSATVPELRVTNTVYFKDEIVRQLDSVQEFDQYTEVQGQGAFFIENRLREHFQSAS